MNRLSNEFIELSTEDLKQIDGGGWLSAAAAAAAALVSGAFYMGYADGKDDCLPPPCKV